VPRVQSLITLAFSAGFFGLSFFSDYRLRRQFALAGLLALLILLIFVPLNLEVPMGDYGTYIEDLGHFQTYMGISEVQFQSHLGSSIVGWLWELMGSTESVDAYGDAFSGYTMIAAAVYMAAAAGVGFIERWSAASLRYISLVTAAPALLLFFGYRELAFEPLAPAVLAFPLLLTGLEAGSTWRLRAGAALLGLAAALHGYALYGMLTGLLIVLLYEASWRTRLQRVLEFSVFSIATYLVMIPVYVILEKVAVTPGHTVSVPFRPLFEQKIMEYRYVHPVLTSWEGFREPALMYICGGALLYIPAAIAKVPPAVKKAVLIAVIPALILFALTWPVQGAGNDTDLALGLFPAVFALAWLVSRELRTSAIGWGFLAIGHVFFWKFMVTGHFVVGQQVQ
jgi:hypothetical protein